VGLAHVRFERGDPNKVSHSCVGLTEGTGGSNVFEDMPITNCILDLDTTGNALINLTVSNSVIRYHGGQIRLHNVTFINCTFIFDVPKKSPPAEPSVLFAVLNSDDQKSVNVSTQR
jgi:hypothetical protein